MRKYFFGYFCFLITMGLQAQAPVRVIPPSPNAASLGKYGAMPVSTYTGIPTISLPFYEIKEGDIAVPISLSYHASGIKVEEEASWVGLGWSLNAGGVIAKSIFGLPDEKGLKGYFATPPLPDATSQNGFVSVLAPHTSYFHQLKCNPIVNDQPLDGKYKSFMTTLGSTDFQPDLYYYNFAGASGKFVRKKDQTVQMLDQQKVKIDPITDGWKVIAANGLQYEFTAAENSSDDLVGLGNGSWFLTKITDTKGNQVNFYYELLGWSHAQPSLSEVSYHGTSQENIIRKNTTSNQVLALTRITWSTGQIIFERHPDIREDLWVGNGTTEVASKLRSIKIYNSPVVNPPAGNLLKEFELVTSYFTAYPSGDYSDPVVHTLTHAKRSKRLRLDRIIEKNGTLVKPPYIFTYNTASLPTKTSYARDHWGYSNDANGNMSLIPAFKGRLTLESNSSGIQYYDLPGANRTPKEIASKACILESIQYPTGGSTHFDYSAHVGVYDGSQGEKKTQIKNQKAFVVLRAPVDFIYQYETTTFIAFDGVEPVTRNCFVNLKLNYTIMASNQSFAYQSVRWEIWREEDTVNPWKVWFLQHPLEYAGGGSGVLKYRYEVTLEKGKKYTLKAITPTKASYERENFLRLNDSEIAVEEISYDPNRDVQVGGVRVSKITDYDGINHLNDKVKDFQYEDGVLMTYPIYNRQYWTGGTCTANANVIVLERSSGSNVPLGSSAQGSPVGYGKVTVLHGGPEGPFGKTLYTYHNRPDIVIPYSGRPNSMPSFPDLLNGREMSHIDYQIKNGQFQPVRMVITTNALANEQIIRGGIGENRLSGDYDCYSAEMIGACGDRSFSPGTHLHIYDIPSAWQQVVKTEEVIYNQDDVSQFTRMVTDYFYDNVQHYQVTRTQKTISANEKIITQLTYPEDYTDNSGFIQDLKTAFIVISPIEKVTYRSIYDPITQITTNKVIQGELSTYLPGSKGLLNEVYTLDLTQPTLFTNFKFSNKDAGVADPFGAPKRNFSWDTRYYSRKIHYQQYDPLKSNLLQVRVENSVPTAYVWGYNNTYPIAEAKNALASEIAFSSFESGTNEGGWLYAGSPTVGVAKVGKSYYLLSAGNLSKSLPLGTYRLSYWAKGTIVVSGGTISDLPTSVADANGWRLFEKVVTLSATTTLSLTGGADAWLDELRVCPLNAQMTTYVYDPLIGMTAVTDVNQVTTYYGYDALQRITNIRNQDGNIVKNLIYHYKGQP